MLCLGLVGLGAAFVRGSGQMPPWSYIGLLAALAVCAGLLWLIGSALDRRRRSIRIAAGMPRYSPD